MITCRLSDLANSIQESSVPRWLRDYLDMNRNEIRFDLHTTGNHIISCPDGSEIVIKRNPS